jgi:hypothetical protein
LPRQIADGLLLVFFHAIKDTDPMANNDPNRREEGWSNFCGTANMGDEVGTVLHFYRRLFTEDFMRGSKIPAD